MPQRPTRLDASTKKLNKIKHERKNDKSRFTIFEHLTNCLWYKDPSLFMSLIFILMFQSYIIVEVINLPSYYVHRTERYIFIAWLNEMINFTITQGCRRVWERTFQHFSFLFKLQKLNLFLNLCKLTILENLMHLNQFFFFLSFVKLLKCICSISVRNVRRGYAKLT